MSTSQAQIPWAATVPSKAAVQRAVVPADADVGAAWAATGLPRARLAEMAYGLTVGSQIGGRPALRRKGTDQLLGWLESWPGQTWQQRWLASGSEDLAGSWAEPAIQFVFDRASPPCVLSSARRSVQFGVHALLCLGVLRPGYGWLCRAGLHATFEHVRQLSDPEFVADLSERCRRADHRPRHEIDALNHLSRIIMHTGRGPRELTTADLLAYHAGLIAIGRQGDCFELLWDLLRETNVLPDDTPSFRQIRRRGRLSIAELVDEFDLSCRPVRDVLVRYLTERSAGMDHSSVRNLVGYLVGSFWKDLETHHPGIDSLRLQPPVADGWKQRAALKRGRGTAGQPRVDRFQILFAVRSFYLDVAQWAVEDPTWIAWVAPNPVRAEDVRGTQKFKRSRTARMHQRTRTLAPVLPHLVDSVEARLSYLERLTTAAEAASVGETFRLDGETFQRILANIDHQPGVTGAGHLRVLRASDRQRLDLTHDEEEAFWTWTIVETLRHTGVRVEELLELTHLALVTHTLPDTGEVVPLLQVAPSKQDTERVLLVSPELAHVLARLVHRVRAGADHVPLVARYDHHERTTGPALPHLFQRRHGAQLRVISPEVVNRLLRRAMERTGLHGPDGKPLHYTPHDFRRIFATEAVSGGLPVHIAAKVLGHRDLSTTQAYTAVYQDDVLRHHSAFIHRRRAQRPSEEYREPTPEEWADFERHFTRRKVELGTCARPYGTPCRHEHACIRCPMLRPDPAQAQRLVEIIANLHDRLREATERGWLGEVEGLQASLAGARQKYQQMRKLRSQTTVVQLGSPRSSTNPP